MGLIINKLSPQLRFGNLLKQLDLDVGEPERQINIHFGGPVEHGRGFVLHSPDYTGGDGTMTLGDGFAMTATLDVLEDIARGTGPTDVILALGYSGWGPGQLESEIVGNGWLICDASSALVFSADDDAKWAAALDTIGVDAKTLSGSAGHA